MGIGISIGLTLVAKNTPSVPAARLSESDIQPLIEFVQEGKSSASLLRILRHINESKQWIMCHCKGDADLLAMPAMTVARMNGGTLYLRNLSGRPLHSNECPFTYNPSTSLEPKDRGLLLQLNRDSVKDQADLPNSSSIPGTELKNPLDLHLDNVVRAASSTGARYKATRSASVRRKPEYPALGQVLLHLMGSAGMLSQASNFDLLQSFKAISKTAEGIKAFGDIPLNDVLVFSPKRLQSLKDTVRLHRSRGIPSAYGLAVIIIHKIHPLEGGKVRLLRESDQDKDNEWSCVPQGEVKIRARRSITKGPFLAAITYAPNDADLEPQAKHAFVLPILSRRRLLPVESDLERRAAMSLVKLIEWAKTKRNLEFRIEKPMYEIETNVGMCRPDFVMQGLGKKAIVEVMGMMADAEYRLRKERTLPIMEAYAPVVQFAPTKAADDAQMSEGLKSMNKSVLSLLFKRQS